jgi:hypothetical protein
MKVQPLIIRPPLIGVTELFRRGLILRNLHVKLGLLQEEITADSNRQQ